MPERILVIDFLIAMAATLGAQTIEGPVFEVVSLKRLESSNVIQPMTGGPGTPTPTRATMIFIASGFLNEAFGLPTHQLVTNSKVPTDFYEFTAIIPAGATKDEFRLMVRNMLIERFHLRYHRETREMKQYDLTVLESGHKLKDTTNEPPPVMPREISAPAGPDGYPAPPPGVNIGPRAMSGKWMLQRVQTSLDSFAADIGSFLGGHVANKTGLKGKYDFSLRWMTNNPTAAPTSAPDFSDPTLIPAMRQQLGLVIREGKGPVDIVVIDAMDKEATPN